MVVRYSYQHLINGLVFKWWSEYWTKLSPVYKWHLITGPLVDWKTFDHSNIRLVQFKDPHHTGVTLKPLCTTILWVLGHWISRLWIPGQKRHWIPGHLTPGTLDSPGHWIPKSILPSQKPAQ